MEAKARQLGRGNTLTYMNPNNGKWLNPRDAAAIEALGIKDHAVMDLHLGSGGGIDIALDVFATYPNYTMGAVNAETNTGSNGFARAITEAVDLNEWLNCAAAACKRIHFRTASFCNQRLGQRNSEWNQGISLFLPNATWLQPPGWVHKLLHSTWQPNGLAVTPLDHWGRAGDRMNATVGASAQASDDGQTVVVRITNQGDQAANVTLTVPGFSGSTRAGPTTWLLRPLVTEGSSWWPDKGSGNTPFQPTRISPRKNSPELAALALADVGADVLHLPAFSYLVVQYG
eukprot:COSAG01_NODE_3106_length_6575_cov_25.785207_4_plen_287_part_00